MSCDFSSVPLPGHYGELPIPPVALLEGLMSLQSPLPDALSIPVPMSAPCIPSRGELFRMVLVYCDIPLRNRLGDESSVHVLPNIIVFFSDLQSFEF